MKIKFFVCVIALFLLFSTVISVSAMEIAETENTTEAVTATDENVISITLEEALFENANVVSLLHLSVKEYGDYISWPVDVLFNSNDKSVYLMNHSKRLGDGYGNFVSGPGYIVLDIAESNDSFYPYTINFEIKPEAGEMNLVYTDGNTYSIIQGAESIEIIKKSIPMLPDFVETTTAPSYDEPAEVTTDKNADASPVISGRSNFSTLYLIFIIMLMIVLIIVALIVLIIISLIKKHKNKANAAENKSNKNKNNKNQQTNKKNTVKSTKEKTSQANAERDIDYVEITNQTFDNLAITPEPVIEDPIITVQRKMMDVYIKKSDAMIEFENIKYVNISNSDILNANDIPVEFKCTNTDLSNYILIDDKYLGINFKYKFTFKPTFSFIDRIFVYDMYRAKADLPIRNLVPAELEKIDTDTYRLIKKGSFEF